MAKLNIVSEDDFSLEGTDRKDDPIYVDTTKGKLVVTHEVTKDVIYVDMHPAAKEDLSKSVGRMSDEIEGFAGDNVTDPNIPSSSVVKVGDKEVSIWANEICATPEEIAAAKKRYAEIVRGIEERNRENRVLFTAELKGVSNEDASKLVAEGLGVYPVMQETIFTYTAVVPAELYDIRHEDLDEDDDDVNTLFIHLSVWHQYLTNKKDNRPINSDVMAAQIINSLVYLCQVFSLPLKWKKTADSDWIIVD
jgi:hypothetical protein